MNSTSKSHLDRLPISHLATLMVSPQSSSMIDTLFYVLLFHFGYVFTRVSLWPFLTSLVS